MPGKRKRHISLKDLATELDVSISTVSRALKDHPNISPEVKERVRKLAEAWDYRPNPLAMGLLRQNTRTIGVIVPDLVTHFFSSVISGIESYASQQGYYIIISSSYESFQKEKECIENLLNSRVEGLIVSLSYQTKDHAHFEDLVRKGIPIVFFDRICLPEKVSTVVADNFEAARKITHHFAEAGYKKIAYIAGPEFLNITRERLEGYLTGLKDHHIKLNREYLVHCEMNPESATEATRKLLALPERPDAIFGINDTVAFAAMKEVRKQGLRIPEEVSIVGFTDDYHASVVHPSLTSITHPTFEMGETAAKLFFESLDGGAAPRQVELKTKLVVRESSSRK
ncbi:MAG: LacI family DNA-binding transcriptional regulator [Bacteroidales bacterium]|nr:LacI family DNA-binding transcriptional regulator [Bacteroidales bacterium]